ncbi:MAG: hypothetical protein RJA98_378 [Pseudomonadota bacterium]|jgi:thiol-disulfide isomerase/thioredoxin
MPPLPLVACLCAAWCGTCNQYRTLFDTLAAEFAGQAVFRWADIEDHADALGDALDVEDFPTLLIAGGDNCAVFFGPVLPHAQTARQLIQRALRGELPAAACEPPNLPARVRGLGD